MAGGIHLQPSCNVSHTAGKTMILCSLVEERVMQYSGAEEKQLETDLISIAKCITMLANSLSSSWQDRYT